MGCFGSSSFEGVMFSEAKPRVWLIAGGPGSRKNNICEWIIRDYKMKYLSAHDIMQFEIDRNGNDAVTLNKYFTENKPIPSDLAAKLVKKAIASCGIRRFLVDEFPRNLQDIIEFDKIVNSKDIIIQKFIYVDADKNMMIQSGLQAKKSDKNSIEQNKKLISKIVQDYLKDIKQIITQYQKRNNLWKLNVNNGPQDAFRSLKNMLTSQGVYEPKPINVFFSHFDDTKYQGIYCDDLIRKYGCYFYTASELISQQKQKKSKQSQFISSCQKQKKQIPPQFVISLIKKKVQKHDNSGTFLISGYPRTSYDSQQWDKSFGWQSDVKGYLSFEIPDQQFKPIFQKRVKNNFPDLKKQQIESRYINYQQNQVQICKFYEKQNKLLKIDSTNQKQVFSSISRFFQQNGCIARQKIYPKIHLIFMSTLSSDGNYICEFLKTNHKIIVLDFELLLESTIKQKSLYSELIQSYTKSGRPVPGWIAVRILTNSLKELKEGKVLIKGFPNSAEQLTVWQQEVGQCLQLYNIIFYQIDKKYISQRVKKLIKQQKMLGNENEIVNSNLKNSQTLEKKLTNSDWKFSKIKSQDSLQVSINFLKKDLESTNYLLNM